MNTGFQNPFNLELLVVDGGNDFVDPNGIDYAGVRVITEYRVNHRASCSRPGVRQVAEGARLRVEKAFNLQRHARLRIDALRRRDGPMVFHDSGKGRRI